MGYGAQARRVPAKGGGQLTDVDIYKVGLVGRLERGFSGVVHDEIYSMNDFEIKCGLYNSSYYAGYVAKTFFEELNQDVDVEMKVLGYVDAGAAQATYAIVDQDGTPETVWDANAGMKNVADTSAFGNKIAVKVSSSNNVTMKLTSDTGAAPTSAVLDSVDNLAVGYYVRFIDGAFDETAVITSLDVATKTIGFAALANAYTAATGSVSRWDITIKVGVKDPTGSYEEKESWDQLPMALSSTIGIAASINDAISGSDYIILAHNAANTTADAADQIPATLSSWTALTGGSDGAAPNDANWDTLINASFNDADVTIMLAPESTSVTHNGNMADFCTSGYKSIYYAQSSNQATEATLKNFGASLRKPFTFAMLPSDKWIETDNPIDNSKISIPKVGVDAAHWFNSYSFFGESKCAAGNKPEMVLNSSDRLIDDNGLVHNDRLGVGDRLIRKYSVNICQYRKGIGITNNSARTLSTDGGYQFQNQIMAFLLYKKSILSYLQTIEQDRSGINAQQSHRNKVWAYMKRKYDAGHLYQGQHEDGTATEFKDVCKIVNDFTINTLANIANGIEEIFVQFTAPPPIEEPILSLASASVTIIRG